MRDREPSSDSIESGPGPSATVGASVLETVARAIGSAPRVLLRDTGPGEEPGPVVRPAGADGLDRSTRYRIDGEIARGGMGVVLKGRDPDLGRDVALKVLRDDHCDDTDMMRRFVEEAQIGGQLQHPGIVPIYELGAFADHRPFFAMKLVKGHTLAQLLETRADRDADRARFLSIFEDVAQTVAYAHARGVIHRDLKPSNVMVGSFGEVQVMDWGLAKVLPRGGVTDDARAGKEDRNSTVIATARTNSEDPELSHFGSVLGTPAYMAPEQARGEVDSVDERTDAFALGSILCEILTGAPAFLGRSSGEIQRKAALGDLADAFARLDSCGADAELVALAKLCLAREPEDRMRHAGAVADRVTAYLSGVQKRLRAAEVARAAEMARAEEAIVRARAERRARRLQVGLAASLLVLTTACGLGCTSWMVNRQRWEARLAQLLAEASALKERARRDRGDASAWREALAALDRADAQGAGQRVATLRQEIEAGLDEAERYSRLRQELVEIRGNRQDVGSAATDAAYAAAFDAAGLNLDKLELAEFARRLGLHGSEAAIEVSAFLDDWSAARRGARRPLASWRRPLETARRSDPDPYRDRLRAALMVEDRQSRAAELKAMAADPEAAALPAPTAALLGSTLSALGEIDAAVALLRGAVGQHPGDVWVNKTLAYALTRLLPPAQQEALRYYTSARALRPETAHDLAHLLEENSLDREAESVFRDLVKRRPENARHLTCLARNLAARGHAAEAAPLFDRAIAAARAALKSPVTDVPSTLDTIGLALIAQGKSAEAIPVYREAVRVDPDFAVGHLNLASALGNLGQLDAAIAEYRESIRLRPDFATSHLDLGNILSGRGQFDAAIAEYREAIRLRPGDIDAHLALGSILSDSKHNYSAAEAEFREIIRLKPLEAAGHYNLGNVFKHEGKLDDAIAEYHAAIRLRPDDLPSHVNLGGLLCDLKHDYAGAEAEFREAIRLRPDDADSRVGLGVTLNAQGKLDEAVAAYRAATRLKPDDLKAHYGLGHALEKQGKRDEALTQYRLLIRLKPDSPDAHYSAGHALEQQGKLDDAIAEYREAIRLKTDDPVAHTSLGNALQNQGKLDEAVAEYREAIRLDPEYAESFCNLGLLLQNRGDHAGALALLRRGHELGSRRPGWQYPSAQWVAHAEQLAALAARLPALLKGEERPKDDAERLALGRLCYDTTRYTAAARFWSEALAADPKLGDDRGALHRYNAACAAALAAAGQGTDVPKPDEGARAKLRSQALDWLKAELAVWEALVNSGDSQARARVRQSLEHWQTDPDLAGVRDGDALAKLPASDRSAWQALWGEVIAVLKRCGTTGP
jgi:eukaryotic-like serine/threonine-protein kinase